MKDQRSRFYHRRNPLHGESGRFASDTTLYTRFDGSSRWLRHFHGGDDPQERARLEWLNDEARRFTLTMIAVVIAALLIIFR
jgi:hypothetical protein